MIQALENPINFDEFIAWYPDSLKRYELHRGLIVEMPNPKGKHSEVGGFLVSQFGIEVCRSHFPFFIPRECTVRVDNGDSAYKPDVIVLDRQTISDDPRWEKESVITKGASARLVVEIVSTNWRDDYAHKFADYEALEIPEYWMVDYLGLGGKRYIGSPKQPTLSVCQLIDEEYQIQQFRGNERIISPTFPDLQLTASQIFSAGQ